MIRQARIVARTMTGDEDIGIRREMMVSSGAKHHPGQARFLQFAPVKGAEMEQLEKALQDLKGIIATFREEVAALSDEFSNSRVAISPAQLQAKLGTMQERIRQAATERYARFLEEAAHVESELRAKLQQVRNFREQADQTSTYLIALTTGQRTSKKTR